MLTDVRPDALDIVAPMAAHGPLVRLAAVHRIPVLCQKPLAPTLAAAQAIVADVGDRIRLMVHEIMSLQHVPPRSRGAGGGTAHRGE